jgi:hypothetical protein
MYFKIHTNNKAYGLTTHTIAESAAFLLHVQEIPGSNLGLETR